SGECRAGLARHSLFTNYSLILLRVCYTPHFADNGNLDLSRVLHVALNFLGDIEAELTCAFVGCFLGIDDDAKLASCLDGVAFFNAVEAEAHVFKFTETLDVLLHDFAARPRSGTTDGVT